jgi:hypothetical protein
MSEEQAKKRLEELQAKIQELNNQLDLVILEAKEIESEVS